MRIVMIVSKMQKFGNQLIRLLNPKLIKRKSKFINSNKKFINPNNKF